MKSFSATKLYALLFGLFLGLCIWKFGNPVILDHQIATPTNTAEFLADAWPTRWANWILLPLAALGALLALNQNGWRTLSGWGERPRELLQSNTPGSRGRSLHRAWLWLLPLAWLAWQCIAATRSVDADLTAATLWQFAGCTACYLLGALLFSRETLSRWLLIGVMAAFTFCLVRAAEQRLFEYPQSRQMLAEGERCGWTNLPPEAIAQFKSQNIIITTNGTDIASPVLMKKFQGGRVPGTLVYPNALAGIILLLWPGVLVIAFTATRQFKPLIRIAAIALAVFLGGAGLFWSGSKLGWLVAIGIAGLYLLRLNWPKRWKVAAVGLVLILGLGIFAVRFQHYFAAGATSAGARMDYWRAAMQTTIANPIFGTGPGTFQRPYADLKAPESEMARLAHNDYLEQFSDSGIPGGVIYAAWILLALAVAGKKLWRTGGPLDFALFAGTLAWFVQGFGEFSLFIPALAWTAFVLLGLLVFHQPSDK